jgi:AcrR family transcriptional regulator
MPRSAARRTPTAPARSARAPQARSVATRARLLDAAIEALVAHGYAGLTTTEVCRRARLSQGALFKHFETKAGLVGATAERLFQALIDDFRRAFGGGAAPGDRLAAVLRQLARSFRQPRLLAALELYTAARTDAVLRAQLAPVLVHHHANLLREARELFPAAAAANPDFGSIVDTAITALQGDALARLVREDDAASRRGLAMLERWLRAELGG